MELIQVNLNVNCGRNNEIIKKISESIISNHVALLDIDIGFDADRTVLTIIGIPEKIIKACVDTAKLAIELINLNNYQGTHPHIGSLDVCPIIPYANSSIENCQKYSLELGEKISLLGTPVFLYGNSNNFDLSIIRKGNFKELNSKILNKIITPDFGYLPHPTAGATIVGAEKLYLAYNINLMTKDILVAKNIAKEFYGLRKNDLKLKTVQLLAWWQPNFNCCQISTNLLDYEEFGLHDVYDLIGKIALNHHTSVNGSEVIGLIPLKALQVAGRHYNVASLSPEIDAINYLGLNSVKPFNIKDKVLEIKLEGFNELHNIQTD